MKAVGLYLRYLIIAVMVAAFFAPRVYAVTGLGIGLKAGVVTDYDNPNFDPADYDFDDLAYFGGFVKFGKSSFNFEIGVEYYSDKEDFILNDETVETEARDFSINATGKFIINFPVIKPFLGAGIGMHSFTYSYKGPAFGHDNVELTISDDKTYFGYHLVAGGILALPMFPFDLFVEGKIGRVNTDNDPTDFTVIAGGIIFNLP